MRMSIIPILAAAVILAACGPADAGNGAASQTAPVAQVGFNDLLRDPGVPFIGAEAADVTIISFIDYNCPYCKRMQPELAGIVEADPRVRVLYKEWPIFGDASEQASRIAIAASYQGMYEEAHNAFMGSPTPISGADDALRLAREAGVDMARLEQDMRARADDIDAVLQRTGAEAAALALRGTPAFIINGNMIPGALPPGQLEAVVDRLRSGQGLR
jgi:protein-disulfide isomerase